MRGRIERELHLLREYFTHIDHIEHGGEDWFRLGCYAYPPGWRIADAEVVTAPVIFKVGAAYPTAEPYGFYGPAGLNFGGSPPGNPGSGPQPPFQGAWQHFSWAPDGTWTPAADVPRGSNLLIWARSFADRLREGA